jgi:menaquinone-specific isochorismate synthase
MYDLADDRRHARARNSVPDDALNRLAGRVRKTLESAGREGGVQRITEPLPYPVHPLRWLGAQTAGEKIYWSGREDGRRLAAAGIADLLTRRSPGGYDSLREQIEETLSGSGARYYGGLRFDPDTEPGGAWAEFGAWRFVLPRLELVAGEVGTELACNLLPLRDADRVEEIVAEILDSPLPPGKPDGDLPLAISRQDTPDRAGWDANVSRALGSFRHGELDKVVLARRAELEFADELDPELLLANLEATTPGCFHFGFRPGTDAAVFVGASPERLYRREGREISSEAVAGTLPRGNSGEDDESLAARLLGSDKDRREHGYVREGIREALSGLCDELEVEDGVSEMKLSSRRHLVSGIRGTLREGVTDADILSAMSPTPAVGGYPKDATRSFLREAEPFDRGYYAGPVGWIGTDAAEFAVGIRSGLVDGNRLALYSGAGIVEGSTADGEWREIEQKISDFASVLGLDYT